MREEKPLEQIQERIAEAWTDRREGRPEEARGKLMEAVEESKRIGAQGLLVNALGKLAHVEWDESRVEVAERLYREAVEIGRRGGETMKMSLAHSIRHLGDVLRAVGQLTEAEECYREALEIYRGASNPPKLDLANTVYRMALLLRETNRRTVAEPYWQEAARLYEEVTPGLSTEM